VAKSYILDTSALFTLTSGEDGSDMVEDILISAKKGKCHIYPRIVIRQIFLMTAIRIYCI
jgi:hypothetical protein